MRVLILTALGSERDLEQGFARGADMYMIKPFDPADLVDAVSDLLTASPRELEARRQKELDTAHLLSQLEALFGRDQRAH